MSTFKPNKSYMVTNREKDWYDDWNFNDEPQGSGKLSYALADGGYNTDPEDYNEHENVSDDSLPPNFASALVDDLQASAAASPDGVPRLLVFIHGLATDYSGAITTTALLGNQLVNPNGGAQGPFVPYSGLVIGFSWPGYGSSVWSSVFYGTMREHINDSVGAFVNFVTALQSLRDQVEGLEIALVCHSEGNYMGQQGMAGLSEDAGQIFDEVLLLAADLDTNCLEQVDGGDAAAALATHAGEVTVYWNCNDDVLPYSVEFEQKYFVTPSRLGLAGPDDFSAELSNAPAVSCSQVITSDSVERYGVSTHMGYFYIEQVLNDISQCASGASVSGRESCQDTNDLGFALVAGDYVAVRASA